MGSFIIRIDGIDIPPPSGYNFTEADLTVNSHRNAAGYASWDVVRYNVGNIDLSWENLQGTEVQKIITAIRGKKQFNAYFFNTNTGKYETRTFYAGDRPNNLIRFISASTYWASLTVPFVEV